MDNIFVQIDLVNIKTLSPQAYNGLQIYLAIKGDIQIDVNKNSYQLTTNDVLVVNCHDMYSIHGDENNIALVLKIPFEYMRRECEDMLQYTLSCYSGGSSDLKFDEIRRLLIYMMMIYSHMDEGYRLNVRASLFQLLHYLLLNFRSGQLEVKTVPGGKKDSHIASVLDYINENYKQSITLEDLAKREFMSVHYLSKLFKSQVGIGFLEYIGNKRLESAVTDLIYTEEPILKIALQNGFANAKSFSDVFKKRYDDTPNQFRQRYQKKSLAVVTNEAVSYSVEELDGLGELVKYLKLYDKKDEKKTVAKVKDASVFMCSDQQDMEPGNRIIKIGKWSEILNRDVQEELELIQEEIGFDYAHFKGIFGDGVYQFDPGSHYTSYDYVQTLRFLDRIGLTPFIEINLSDALRQFPVIENACKAAADFLLLMHRYCSKEYLDRWKFELKCAVNEDNDFYMDGYYLFYKVIKGILPNCEVGFFAEDTLKEKGESWQELKCVLEYCVDRDCRPDFITFAADPNSEVNTIGMHSDAYMQLRDFHIAIARRMKVFIAEAGLKDIGLYLMRWNTICGQNLLEAGSYYRAALIAEIVLSLDGCIDGIGIWISEKISEQMGAKGSNIINLFHCRTAKRAAYFVLEACSRLGKKLIFRDENIIVTENSCGEYVILTYNPCLFNPLYAMDYNFTRLQEKRFNIALEGMKKGNYNFKVFKYSMNFSFAINDKSSIHALYDVETYRYGDADLISYMQNIACPEFATYEKEIDGVCILEPELPLNGVSMYILSRL